MSDEPKRLFQAALDDDPDDAEEVIPTVLQTIDTPQQRAQLARAVLNLRDRGTLSTRQATAAIIDLAGDTQTLIRSSLINAIFASPRPAASQPPAPYASPREPPSFVPGK